MGVEVTFTNNADKALEERKHKMEMALTAVGAAAEGHAKDYCPVDTGRLRNSISNTHDDDSAYIGSNVEYAAYVELGTSRRKAKPYLKPAVTQHTAEYKSLVQEAFKS
jgi:HK97 gp10 family phage protein